MVKNYMKQNQGFITFNQIKESGTSYSAVEKLLILENLKKKN